MIPAGYCALHDETFSRVSAEPLSYLRHFSSSALLTSHGLKPMVTGSVVPMALREVWIPERQ